jgi:hypothetical protein
MMRKSLLICSLFMSRVAFGVVPASNAYTSTYEFDEPVAFGAAADGQGNNPFPAASLGGGVAAQGGAGHNGKSITLLQGKQAEAPFNKFPSGPAITVEAWAQFVNQAADSFNRLNGYITILGAITLANLAAEDARLVLYQKTADGVNWFPVAQLETSANGAAWAPVCSTLYPTAQANFSGATVSSVGAAWHHLGMSYDGVNIRTFVDGHSYGAAPCGAGPLSYPAVLPAGGFVSGLVIGSDPGIHYTDSYDELRIASGRNEPSGCPTHLSNGGPDMIDSGAGFCISSKVQTEASYGDSLNQCALEFAEVCSLSQIYTAVRLALIADPGPLGNGYRIRDALYFDNGGFGNASYFGGYSNAHHPINTLTMPAVSAMARPPGPSGENHDYFCCRTSR